MIGVPWRRGNRSLRLARFAFFAILLLAVVLARGHSGAERGINIVWYVGAAVFFIAFVTLWIRRYEQRGFGRRRVNKVERPAASHAPIYHPPTYHAPSPGTANTTSPTSLIRPPSSPTPGTVGGLTYSGQPAPEVETPPESS